MNLSVSSFQGLKALSIACFFCSNLAFSQEQPLKPTVVTASRTEQIVADVIPHTTVLGRGAIEQSQLMDLPSLLAREAGFQFTQNGGRGMQASAFLRGAASMQVLVLVDGVPMTKQDTTGAVSLEHIMLDQVDRIEIVRGNVSAIYGSGAVGGVIQIFTRQGSAQPSAFATTETGSLGSLRLLLGTQGAIGAWRYALSAGSSSTNGISAMNPLQGSNINPDSDGYENKSLSLNMSYQIGPDSTIGLRTHATDGRFAYDTAYGSTDMDKGTTHIRSQSVFWNTQVAPTWLSKVNLTDLIEKNTTSNISANSFSTLSQTHQQLVSWVNEIRLNHSTATFGGDIQNQSVKALDDTGFTTPLQKSRSATAVYGGWLYSEGLNSLQANIRHDQVQSTGTNNSAYLGFGREFASEWKFTMAYSTAFNVAPIGYLFDPTYGNPGLKPEKAATQEVGVQWQHGSQLLRSTLFSTRTKDLLLFDPTINAPNGSFSNVSSAKNAGLESSYTASFQQTDLRASLTLQNPTNLASGMRLARRAQVLASTSLNHSSGPWTWGGSLRYTGVRSDTDGKPGLPGYALLDTMGRFSINRDWVVFGRIENVTDQSYQTAYGYHQLPRTFYLGTTWHMPK